MASKRSQIVGANRIVSSHYHRDAHTKSLIPQIDKQIRRGSELIIAWQ